MSPSADQITTYAQEKHLSARTLARWQTWAADDQAAFLSLVQTLQIGENHIRDLLDWLEEIRLRDGVTVCDVLARPEIARPLAAQLGRNDRLKAVKEALRKVRYPRLSRLEEKVRAAVKALDLGGRVRVSFPSVLEGDEMTIEIKARSVQELDDSVTRLRQQIDAGGIQHLFGLFDEV